MENENETVAELVKETRQVANNVAIANKETKEHWRPAAFLANTADRIEAAHNREVAELVKVNERLQAHFDGVIKRKDAEIGKLRDEVLRLKDVLANERAQHTAAEARKNAEIAELERRIKVAVDALEMCKNAMCNYCRSTPDAKGLPCLAGCETLSVAKNALDAIREEGGVK